jgi:hypothetical protein
MRFSLTTDDSSVSAVQLLFIYQTSIIYNLDIFLFRLYYESSKSTDRKAYGVKQTQLLNGFKAIGRLESLHQKLAET